MGTSRRELLRSIGGTSVLAASVGTASAQDLKKGAVIPEVDEFEGNYTGQWLELNEQTTVNGEPVDGCDPAEWSGDDTQGYTGFLMDRRAEEGPIVEVPVLTASGDEGPVADTTYIVNEATECGNGYVWLDLKIVRIRAVATEPSGPEADGDGGGGGGGGGDSIPGFGVGAAALALAASALARAIRRDDR